MESEAECHFGEQSEETAPDGQLRCVHYENDEADEAQWASEPIGDPPVMSTTGKYVCVELDGRMRSVGSG